MFQLDHQEMQFLLDGSAYLRHYGKHKQYIVLELL